ncbi:hypothetical protein HRbin36_01483 [bacterium HR36]|nr:hypothetical protein HRbin36_01483 [bacterium HR36]
MQFGPDLVPQLGLSGALKGKRGFYQGQGWQPLQIADTFQQALEVQSGHNCATMIQLRRAECHQRLRSRLGIEVAPGDFRQFVQVGALQRLLQHCLGRSATVLLVILQTFLAHARQQTIGFRADTRPAPLSILHELVFLLVQHALQQLDGLPPVLLFDQPLGLLELTFRIAIPRQAHLVGLPGRFSCHHRASLRESSYLGKGPTIQETGAEQALKRYPGAY